MSKSLFGFPTVPALPEPHPGNLDILQIIYDILHGYNPFNPLCYLHGTHILTPFGEVCVEDLKIGDLVVTRGNGAKPIKWLGRQSYDARFIEGNRAKLPICINAGALGDDLPKRDLYLSPGHSVLLGGQLVLAESLVNGLTVSQDWAPPQIDYIQIELDIHDCVVAEGAWAETYADIGTQRAQFHNVHEFYELYPDYVAPIALSLCAPRPLRGPPLDSLLREPVARAGAGLKPGRLNGAIDRVFADGTIEGWAQDAAYPDLPVLLEIVRRGHVVGTVLACEHRADLKKAGIRGGRCAFWFKLDEPDFDLDLAGLVVRRASDHAELTMTPACLASASASASEPTKFAA